MCNRVGVMVTTHRLKPENYFTVRSASHSQSESRTAYGQISRAFALC